MARCDYYAIETELQAILQASSTLEGVAIVVEEQMSFTGNVVGIYLEKRETNRDYLAAGQRQQYNLTFSIWCFSFAMELDKAIRARDDLLGKVEVILMANRTINGKVNTLFLTGGEMLPAYKPANAGMVVGAEIRVVADVTFTDT